MQGMVMVVFTLPLTCHNMNTTPENRLAASLEQGFSFAWPLHDNYTVRKNVLLGIGDASRFIAPAGEAGLFASLAKVHGKKITPANFAKEFGLLGHDELSSHEQRRGGDPIPWFLDHARNVSDLLNALEAI